MILSYSIVVTLVACLIGWVMTDLASRRHEESTRSPCEAPIIEPRIMAWTPAELEAFGINDTDRFITETEAALKRIEWDRLTEADRAQFAGIQARQRAEERKAHLATHRPGVIEACCITVGAFETNQTKPIQDFKTANELRSEQGVRASVLDDAETVEVRSWDGTIAKTYKTGGHIR